MRVMLDKRVDGIIVAPCSSLFEDNEHLRQVLAEGRSLMMFDRAVQGMEVETVGRTLLQWLNRPRSCYWRPGINVLLISPACAALHLIRRPSRWAQRRLRNVLAE